MKKFLQKKLNQKGLTLVELLAVIVILGIIAAIAVPAIGNIIENTKYNAVKSDALNALSAANLYYAEEPVKSTISVPELVANGYLENAGKLGENMDITKEDIEGKKVIKITGTSEGYAGEKKVIFDSTVDDINADKQKGSKKGDKTIGATTDDE